jgi:phosphotransferase system  glucose/maltose/N-acetylglucosamine-specific IIC component
MALGGLAFAIGAVVAAVLLIPLLVGGVFVIVTVANRADPDPTGRRPAVVYGFAIAFVTLFVTLFATAGFVASLCNLIGTHARSRSGGLFGNVVRQGGSQHPVGDAVARGCVLSLLVAVVAGVVYYLHATAAARASADAVTGDPNARVRASYVSAVSFVTVGIVVVSLIIVLYDVFRLIAPGVFAPDLAGDRVVVLRSFLPALYLAVVSAALLLMHLRHAPESFRPRYADQLPAGPLAARPRTFEPPITPPAP